MQGLAFALIYSVAGLPFGHIAANATLPVGLRVTLDGRAGDLVIPTGAVR